MHKVELGIDEALLYLMYAFGEIFDIIVGFIKGPQQQFW